MADVNSPGLGQGASDGATSLAWGQAVGLVDLIAIGGGRINGILLSRVSRHLLEVFWGDLNGGNSLVGIVDRSIPRNCDKLSVCGGNDQIIDIAVFVENDVIHSTGRGIALDCQLRADDR